MPEITFKVDKRADVLYFDFGMGEPCYCEEFDDAILVERGIYSDALCGFRVLDFSKYKHGSVSVDVLKGVVKAILSESTHRVPATETRVQRVRQVMETVDAELDALVK